MEWNTNPAPKKQLMGLKKKKRYAVNADPCLVVYYTQDNFCAQAAAISIFLPLTEFHGTEADPIMDKAAMAAET